MNRLSILAPFVLVASFGFTTIPENYRGLTKEELILRHTKKSEEKINTATKKTNTRKLKGSKRKYSFEPVFESEKLSIATLERFNGTIEGNIVSSLHEVTFKVQLQNIYKFPQGTYLSCVGTNVSIKYNYRIIASCERLITPDNEYPVNVGLKDIKLVEGLRPDYIYTGEEDAIIGEGFSAIMGSLIESKKDRIQTSIGFSEKPNIKNAYLSGLVSAARVANNKAKEHSAEKTVVLAVRSGTRVVVEFKRRFKWKK